MTTSHRRAEDRGKRPKKKDGIWAAIVSDWGAKLVSLLIAVAVWAVIESQFTNPRNDRRTKPGAGPGGGSAQVDPDDSTRNPARILEEPHLFVLDEVDGATRLHVADAAADVVMNLPVIANA